VVHVQSCVKPISQIRKEERVLSEGAISKIYLTKKNFKNMPLLIKFSKIYPTTPYWDGGVDPTLIFYFLDFSASKI
jgi:hypothetical protein